MKKNLIILLLIPFLIALLSVVTINVTLTFVENDIMSIKWDYEDVEAFKINQDGYLLEATGVSQKGYPAGTKNSLVWSLKNKNTSDENVYAKIVKDGSNYYLETLQEGEVIITCANEKGNVFRSMQAVIYETGAIIVQSKIKSSQNNIDDMIYYGEYDLIDNQKKYAQIELDIKVIPESLSSNLKITSKTDNIDSIDLNTGLLKIKENYINSNQIASFKATCGNDILPMTYTFTIVDEGINVYSYDDLMYCTNRSINGEIVVLRKSFESLENAYETDDYGNLIVKNNQLVLKENNVECFGNYNIKKKSFDFSSDIYKFTTTYNKNFIDQWNTFVKANGGKNTISDKIVVGLRVQKDFYGNGYTINLHNLTYPTSKKPSFDESGNSVEVAYPGSDDLFKGPLPFFSLGDHNNMPLIEALGQDNIGVYLDGDNITMNDANIKNCDFGNLLNNLDYVGTVVETHGNNITINNSRLSNGRQVLRSYSSMNVNVNNSLLSNSRNFLITIGSNEFLSVDDLKEYIFEYTDGTKINSTITSYFSKDGKGDGILNAYMLGTSNTDTTLLKNSLLSMQKAFNQTSSIEGIYKGSMTINDTYFYRSGVAAISVDSMFNGPFLYNMSPSMLKTALGMLQTQDGISLSEFTPNNLSGISYPVELTISGATKFFDYKTSNQLDTSGLINQSISEFATQLAPDFNGTITVDTIFPIKSYLWEKASKTNKLYSNNGKTYINVPLALYGGGTNLSKVILDNLDNQNQYSNYIEIDLLEKYLTLDNGSTTMELVQNLMMKAVTVVTGYEPFKFMCIDGNGYLFDEEPNVADLVANAKGERK